MNIEFIEYPAIIIKCLNKCEKELQIYQSIFTILSDGQGKYDVLQSTEYKNVEIMSFDFQVIPIQKL